MNKLSVLTPEKAGHNLVAGSDTKKDFLVYFIYRIIKIVTGKIFPTSQKAFSSTFTIWKICLVYFIKLFYPLF